MLAAALQQGFQLFFGYRPARRIVRRIEVERATFRVSGLAKASSRSSAHPSDREPQRHGLMQRRDLRISWVCAAASLNHGRPVDEACDAAMSGVDAGRGHGDLVRLNGSMQARDVGGERFAQLMNAEVVRVEKLARGDRRGAQPLRMNSGVGSSGARRPRRARTFGLPSPALYSSRILEAVRLRTAARAVSCSDFMH